MGEAGSQRRRLACAGTCKDQHRALGRQHGLALRRVQALQISRLGRGGGDFRHLREVGAGADSGNGGKGSYCCSRYPRYPQARAPIFRFARLVAQCIALRVIGTAVAVSPDGLRARRSGSDQNSDLCRQAVGRVFGPDPRPGREEAPEEMIFLLRDAAEAVLRNSGGKAGRGSGHPKKGRGTSELFRLRARHERTQAELPSGREA